MTSGQHIDYDALALDALRGVVKACLAQVSRSGLVGEHHFYIAFNTQAPGVGMSKRLKEKYPLEMTIVLQHRFWDLAVEDDRFEVKLTFDGIPERLVVPFAAVKVFYDPSVPYVLQFEEVDATIPSEGSRKGPRRATGPTRPTGPADAGAGDAEDGQAGEAAGSERLDRRRPARRNRTDKGSDQTARPEQPASSPTDDETPAPQRPGKPTAPPAAAPVAGSKPTVVAVSKVDDSTDSTEDDSGSDAGGAKIFDLSKFRGKK